MISRLLDRIEDWHYRIKTEGWRCTLRLHQSGLWADYGGWCEEPPEAYWHCLRCGADCFPLRWRIYEWFWELPWCERYIAWTMKREQEREEKERNGVSE